LRMKSIGTLLLLVASSFAHDAVIFSSTIKITKDAPALTSLIASALTESPLVFFVNPDFVLGQFSKAAAAYSTRKSDSSIVNAAKGAKYAESRFIPSAVHVPSSFPVSASSPLEKGHSIYLVSAENWSSLDKLAAEVLAVLGDKAIVVVTNSEVVSTNPLLEVRVKRVSGVADATDAFPIVIPKVETEAERKPCLFYLEGLTFIVKGSDGKYLTAKLRDDGTSTSKKYGYEEPVCPDTLSTKANGPQQAIFSFTVTPGSPNKPLDDGWHTLSSIGIKLTMTSTIDGYWSLTNAVLTQQLDITFESNEMVTVPAGSEATPKSMEYMGMDSVFGFSWNCWDSQALFFGAKEQKQIGVSFHGMQVRERMVAVYGMDDGKKTMSFFRTKVDSCTGTFSAASWMGIITSLVLIAVFIFGFLMLNSVQTLDRYDDPKQKQILINVRE
ncbi:hypothetical protein PENTCL1PPCAC_6625, partial [Pristionchus entomophagus]